MKTRLHTLLAVSLIVLGAAPGCRDSSSTGSSPSSTSGGNPVTAPVDYLGAVSKGQQSAVNKLSLTGIQQAIQAYQAQEGKLPKDLQDLVKAKVLAKLPEAPRGMKFSYDPKSGEVKVVPQSGSARFM